MNPSDPTSSGGGLTGSIKVIAAFAVLILAGLASLLVLDVIPQDLFKAALGKVLLLCLIGVATVAALWILVRGSGKR